MEASKKVAILTDSNCDLPQEYFKKYPIFRLPLVVCCGTQSYRDGVDITVQDVYNRQKAEDFTTSLPRPEDIGTTLDAIRDAGYGRVVVLILGSALSGATNLIRLAAQERTDLEIAVFDSKSASVGTGVLAVQAAQYAQRGLPFHVLKKLIDQIIADTYTYFSLNTMEYLQRGGRIGRATAIAGTLLQIKPVLTFDREGVIATSAKVRGRAAVQKRLVELVQAHAPNDGRTRYNLVVCDGNAPEEGAALKAALTAALPDYVNLIHGQIDATLAVHLGPQLLGAGIQLLRSEF